MQVHMVMYFYQAFVTNFFIAKYATNIAKRMLRQIPYETYRQDSLYY